MLNTIEEVLAELRAGRPVLVTDDADRENEGDAILAAELADPRWVGWMVRHTSGYLCAPMTEERADQLDLPLMWPASQDIAHSLHRCCRRGPRDHHRDRRRPACPYRPGPGRSFLHPVGLGASRSRAASAGSGWGSVGEARPH